MATRAITEDIIRDAVRDSFEDFDPDIADRIIKRLKESGVTVQHSRDMLPPGIYVSLAEINSEGQPLPYAHPYQLHASTPRENTNFRGDAEYVRLVADPVGLACARQIAKRS